MTPWKITDEDLAGLADAFGSIHDIEDVPHRVIPASELWTFGNPTEEDEDQVVE